MPIRKPGKLPAATVSESYELEYGTDTVEIHKDAVAEGQRVLLVDDLLATGGTAAASCRLLERVGAELVGGLFVVELTFLDGRNKLEGLEIETLVAY